MTTHTKPDDTARLWAGESWVTREWGAHFQF